MDDEIYAGDSDVENQFVQLFIDSEPSVLADLASYAWEGCHGKEFAISRRPAYALVDRIRSLSPKGV